MKKISFVLVILLALSTSETIAQTEPLDTAAISKIQREGFARSKVLNIVRMLTDVHGPRLTNSKGFKNAATYAKEALASWGVDNVHFDVWDEPFGRGWELKRFAMQNLSPVFFPVIAYPKAWSPGVKGTVQAEAVYLDIKTEADLKKYEGKLKGKFVLFSLPSTIKPDYKPDAWRLSDSLLLQLANALPSEPSFTSRRFRAPGEPQRLAYLKWKLCQEEGVAAILEISPGAKSKDGTLMAHSATVPYPVDYPFSKRVPSYHKNAPKILPQIVLAAEHYNRMVRQVQEGSKVTLALTLETEFTAEAPGYNIIGEITGTDLKDEVVMIGAHFDSWHTGTGATDNGCGAAVMMEAMRLIKTLGVAPRRTIRIALWGGEEQGLLGSRSYVKRFLGERLDRLYPYDSIQFKPAAEKFSVYFNMDHGNGKYRGIYLQGNQHAAPIFRTWLKPFHRMGASTITLKNTSGTDHLAFDAIGLPAFQFIQDPIEYGGRTYHTNMDVYDHVVEDDLKHNAVITALFAWHAANRASLIPRR
ncbi:MAG TPA: M20/M25/M40 family metallo-hydrolase [Ohtaekwangia sp.]|nr:M20/M25/M40 family metallo-hydrolase [Ohtaekwangia sp.]